MFCGWTSARQRRIWQPRGRASLNEFAAATACIALGKIVTRGRPWPQLGYLTVPRGPAPGQRCTPAFLRDPILPYYGVASYGCASVHPGGSPLVRTKVRANPPDDEGAELYPSSSP